MYLCEFTVLRYFLTLLFIFFQQEVPRKHVTVKYSKYDVWQRKAAQRLRRGIPAILRAKKFRRQAERIRAQEQLHHHRPLITLPSKLPPILLPTENYVSHKWNQELLHRVDKKRLGDQSFLSLTSFLWQSSTTHLPSQTDMLTCSSSFYSCCFIHQRQDTSKSKGKTLIAIRAKKRKKDADVSPLPTVRRTSELEEQLAWKNQFHCIPLRWKYLSFSHFTH